MVQNKESFNSLNKFKYLIITVMLQSCATYNFNNTDFHGTYFEKQNPNELLTFEGSRFANIEPGNGHLALFYCCDTITYGTWGSDNDRGLLYLNTSPHLSASIIDLAVKEEVNSQDSLIFVINSPIEEQYKKGRGRERDIYYRLVLTDKIGSPDIESIVVKYETNYIKIAKPKRGITKFSINIFPKDNYSGRNISTRQVNTVDYNIKNPLSNFFNINLPELTDGFITYLRLEKDFIKVINKNELEWHGNLYIKSTSK